MNNCHSDKIIDFLRKIEEIYKEKIDFEYNIGECRSSFYVNFIGKNGIGRMTYYNYGLADFEALDVNGNIILFNHKENIFDVEDIEKGIYDAMRAVD